MSIPGVGPVTASVLTVKMGDASSTNAVAILRHALSSFPGIHYGWEGQSLGISRHGDKNVKRLLVLCVRAYNCEAWRTNPNLIVARGAVPHNDAE